MRPLPRHGGAAQGRARGLPALLVSAVHERPGDALRGAEGDGVRRISFAWTTPALLVGQKTVTRRDWSEVHARGFRKGDLVEAFDKQARFGGKKVAVIRLTETPYQESTGLAPDGDWEAEGFEYLQHLGILVDGLLPAVLWRSWKMFPQLLWVVRFKIGWIVKAWPSGVSP